ncbi:MAG TPA: alpha-glucuronidase family glycosyl hydrolase [Cyclobacteriaceae bacterium]|nr:alpha-glucuronidase family glycosyl hydrolase [Cyclobacteriaceae bacterium]
MKKNLSIFLLLFILQTALAENGYRLWLRYDLIENTQTRNEYLQQIKSILVDGNSPTLTIAKKELIDGLNGLLGTRISASNNPGDNALLLCGTVNSSAIKALNLGTDISDINREGFIIKSLSINKKKVIAIVGKEDIGVLYGAFHFLQLLQSNKSITNLAVTSSPKIKLRVLNHWDNLDRTVERGYAGFSLWDWQKLPEYIDQRYIDYARANASIGINGTVLTNVNANALVLSPNYLKKVTALANVFRPYGIKVYLTARFSAPIELDKLPTADPLDPTVQQWWRDKTKEIYSLIPDFGGFVVKANSEGQPGPQNYGRSHKDGANMLADAVQPYNGVVMWRAFVYDDKVPDDRARQAYNEFKPLDGTFRKNVLIQVKNGAIDFQPREPFHPLFGAMPQTPLMMEFQLTQEYLGFSTHLVYLAPLFKETLDSDTYSKGKGSTVAKVIDGSLDQHEFSGIAGVANIGTDMNWCGHPFAQSNWFAFGRLAWNPELTSEQIADDWIRLTFSNKKEVVEPVKSMMLASREITVNYMTPLGLHHIMGWSHHYGPGPWIKDKHRADWTSVYYHKADSLGIGFNRTASGSNAINQYSKPVADLFSSTQTCPEKYLLWFNHVSWDYKTQSGKSLWDALCYSYYNGADSVVWMQKTWNSLEGKIDPDRFKQVKMLLNIQHDEAVWWRDACVLYFQTFSKRPIPSGLEKPLNTLDYYMKLSYPYAPGIRPQW